jgi:hypothetical protein
MGKRQTRIFAKDILQQLPVIINQEANVLLKNGTVFHGIFQQSATSGFLLKDMLGRSHIIAAEDIAAIILDKEALY